MGLDLSLFRGDEEVVELNWSRNPFGLCQWAEDNADPGIDFSLYFVCNEWAYSKGDQVNRPLFKSVVDAYGEMVKALEFGYFWFPESNLEQSVRNFQSGNYPTPGLVTVEMVQQARFVEFRNGKYGIPMTMFHSPHSRFDYSEDLRLPRYKEWFTRLESFAEQLQDETLRFYCSN